MPFVNYMLSSRVTDEAAVRLKEQTAKLVQEHAGKGEEWLYIRFASEQDLYFKGARVRDGGVIEVKLVGTLSSAAKRAIVKGISAALSRELGLSPGSIYVIITEVKGTDWGWNAETFG